MSGKTQPLVSHMNLANKKYATNVSVYYTDNNQYIKRLERFDVSLWVGDWTTVVVQMLNNVCSAVQSPPPHEEQQLTADVVMPLQNGTWQLADLGALKFPCVALEGSSPI